MDERGIVRKSQSTLGRRCVARLRRRWEHDLRPLPDCLALFQRTDCGCMNRTAVALAFVTLSVGCSRTAAQQPPPQPPQVTVANVLAREVTEWDEFTGRLEAVDSVAVRPRVSGYVEAVRFVEGAIVRKGALLFQVDARPFQAEVDRLRAELARAKATAQRADSELQRATRLRAENAISSEEHDRRAAFSQESAAQIAAVEAAL